MFLGSRNPLLIFLQSYHVWVTSKIQVDFRFKTYSEVLVNVSCRFLKFLDYSCFWGQGIHCWYFYRATMFDDLENPGKLPVQHVIGGTGDCVLSNFEISSLFMFLRPGNPLLTFLLSYHVRAISKIQVTFPFKMFLKLPKHSFFGKNALNL